MLGYAGLAGAALADVPGQSSTNQNPPFDRRRIELNAQIVAAAQPDSWVYGFQGGAQPYAPRRLTPSTIQVDNPPFRHRERTPQQLAIVSQMQPDPWVYAYAGGAQPYAPLRMSPGIPGLPVNNPPFDRRRSEIAVSLVALAQPDPWAYASQGGAGPYMPKPAFAQEEAGMPPFDRRRLEALALLTASWQPPTWPYVFVGGAQPYAPAAVLVYTEEISNFPPYDQRRIETMMAIVTATQPDPWVYTFQGGPQPWAPKPAPPSEIAIPPIIPGGGKRYQKPTDYLPQPAWDVVPRKPIRPIWDRVREQENAPPLPPPPPGPPPGALFDLPPGLQDGQIAPLPDYGVTDSLSMGRHLEAMRNEADDERALLLLMDAIEEQERLAALAAIQALGLLGE